MFNRGLSIIRFFRVLVKVFLAVLFDIIKEGFDVCLRNPELVNGRINNAKGLV